jgi:hypothetical protein
MRLGPETGFNPEDLDIDHRLPGVAARFVELILPRPLGNSFNAFGIREELAGSAKAVLISRMAMKFKYPGGDIAFVTSIWLLAIPLGISLGLAQGHFAWYVVVAVLVGLVACGMWFQSAAAGYVFGGVNVLMAVIGLLGLLLGGLSLRDSARVAYVIYSAWVAIAWARNQEEVIGDLYYSPENWERAQEQFKLRGLDPQRPYLVAARRGLLLGSGIGAILGAITDSIILYYCLKSPSEAFAGNAPILVFTVFGIGPIVIGGLVCAAGFAVARVVRNRLG